MGGKKCVKSQHETLRRIKENSVRHVQKFAISIHGVFDDFYGIYVKWLEENILCGLVEKRHSLNCKYARLEGKCKYITNVKYVFCLCRVSSTHSIGELFCRFENTRLLFVIAMLDFPENIVFKLKFDYENWCFYRFWFNSISPLIMW